MLNPSLITAAVAGILAKIPLFSAAMTVGTGQTAEVRIADYHYLLGEEHRLAEAIYKGAAPSTLVVWEGTLGGNFNGYVVWKHRVAVYLRMANMAGATSAVGYEDLWWMLCNGIPEGYTQNIRYINILPQLDIMDTPSVTHMVDGDGIDIFRGELIFPEIGDS